MATQKKEKSTGKKNPTPETNKSSTSLTKIFRLRDSFFDIYITIKVVRKKTFDN